MPPQSRGLLVLHLIRRHASTAPNPSRKRPLKIPARIPEMPVAKPDPPAAGEPLEPPTHFLQNLFRAFRGAPSVGNRPSDRLGANFRITSRILWTLLLAVPVIVVINDHFPFSIVPVSGTSMHPALNGDHRPDMPNTNDVVLVDRRYPAWVGVRGAGDRSIKRGMMVLFSSPLDPQRVALKRVVALEGDVLYPKHPYPDAEEGRGVLVPFGQVWVEGDIGHTEKSLDSNAYGPIPQNLIQGIVRHVIWPMKHFSPVRWEEWKGIGHRLEENAAKLADPDDVQISEKFLDGTAAKTLGYLRLNGQRERLMQTPEGKKELAKIGKWAEVEAQRRNPETISLAEEILNELKRPWQEEKTKASSQASVNV